MELVRILDHVGSCSTYEDGDVIFDLLERPLRRGEDVALSFDGVTAVPSSFINASIIRLAERLSLDAIKAHLRIVDSTKQINEMVRSRMQFVASEARGSV